MSKRNRKQKQEPEAEQKQIKKEKAGPEEVIDRKLEEVIDRELEDGISKEEASILLDALIEHFDGFARQQEFVIKYMNSKYRWGNKRTIRVLKVLAQIGVIERTRSKGDNWTLFFLVKGFLDKCKERMDQAVDAIKLILCQYHSAIIPRRRVGLRRAVT